MTTQKSQFMTEMGSTYTLGADGRYSRHKAVESRDYPPADITVFVRDFTTNPSSLVHDVVYRDTEFSRRFADDYKALLAEARLLLLRAVRDENGRIVEYDEIHDTEESMEDDELFCGVVRTKSDGSLQGMGLVPVTLNPEIGATVLEFRRSSSSEELVPFHVGHRVTSLMGPVAVSAVMA